MIFERRRVLPALTERVIEVAHRRASDADLDVMPRRVLAVPVVHLLGLHVSEMALVVAAAVAQVDPADEGDVATPCVYVADQHQLLVVGACRADPLVEDHGSAGVDVLRELHMALQVEAGELRV